MSIDTGSDLDLFVGVRKFDGEGREVEFWNRLSRRDIVTRGWLRASRRPNTASVVDSLLPVSDYERERSVVPNEVIELNVELLPSSTFFEAGTSFVLELRGRNMVGDIGWAAAGTWNDNFGANPNDIVRVAGGIVTDLKRG